MNKVQEIEGAEAPSLALPSRAMPDCAEPCRAAPRLAPHPYHKKLARVLDRMGGLYELSDILDALAKGRMQSFIYGNSWLVSQITLFPRRRVLEIVFALGDLGDLRILHGQVLKYAQDNNISLVSAHGRRGWFRDADRRGWRVKAESYLYHRDL
jgi:hypothetical protein